MHVLITADTVGGVWTYTRELVTALAERAVRVTLVSFGEIPTPQQTAWLDGLTTVEFRPTAFRLEWMQDSQSDLEASAEYLANIISEVKPELLHLNQYFYGSLSGDVPRLVVAHSDVVSWWQAVYGDEPPANDWSRWYRQMVAGGISSADAVVAPSRWMLEALARHYVRPAHASVIYNGRSPWLFNPHVSKEDYILSVGRLWDSGKQVRLLVQQDMPLATYIVGSEVHPDAGYQAGLPAKSSGRLMIKGPQSEVELRQLYGRASMYIATSCYEPFGLAPVEAALSRCALVMNDTASFRELWGETAYYFAKNDAASLREVVTHLQADRELRLKYANRAYRRALELFTSKRMAEDYLELYQSLVSAPSVAA